MVKLLCLSLVLSVGTNLATSWVISYTASYVEVTMGLVQIVLSIQSTIIAMIWMTFLFIAKELD